MARAPNPPFPAEITFDLPDDLAQAIGRLVALYAHIEHKLTSLSGLILQLDKAEMRVAIKTPRLAERFDMALDLFALKGIRMPFDTEAVKSQFTRLTTERDRVAHGLWLKHPTTGDLYLQITRGQWEKGLSDGATISRAVFPQSIPYSASNAEDALALGRQALQAVEDLGAELDRCLRQHPDRFQSPSITRASVCPESPTIADLLCHVCN
jgi:hypothetical protein